MKTMMKFTSCICLLLFVFLQGCEPDYGAMRREEDEKLGPLAEENHRLTRELASMRVELEQVQTERRNHAEMLKQLETLSKKGVWSFLSTERNRFVFYLMILWPFMACAGCWIVWRIV